MTRARLGPAIAIGAVIGLAIATYLLYTRLTGGIPACGGSSGCETVALSEYATLLGLPVALYGVGYSGLVLLLALAWWRTGDRRAILAVYGLGFAGLLAVGYLTYLEIFVIGAICIWCVAYAVSVVATFGLAALAVIRTS
ncbi:MAG TPA: vitamin K epoxide reductase family protein [Candidatus Limnocylindrales bacterium]